MSETTAIPSIEDDIERMKMEAGFAQVGQPVPIPEDEELPDGTATAEDDSPGSESADGVNDTTETDSTAEVDSGTDSTTDEIEELAADAGKDVSDTDSETDGDKKSKRQENKDKALDRSWDNANKRHGDADTRSTELDARETALATAEQHLKQRDTPAPADPLPNYKATDIGQSINEFIDDNDIETAKHLVLSLAAKADANKEFTDVSPTSAPFQQALKQVRAKVYADNPELSDQKSDLYKDSLGLLEGDWAPILTAHPGGIYAAVEVAKLQKVAASVPELNKQIEQLKTEISQFKRSTQLGKTGASARGNPASKPAGTLKTVQSDIDALYRDAR